MSGDGKQLEKMRRAKCSRIEANKYQFTRNLYKRSKSCDNEIGELKHIREKRYKDELERVLDTLFECESSCVKKLSVQKEKTKKIEDHVTRLQAYLKILEEEAEKKEKKLREIRMKMEKRDENEEEKILTKRIHLEHSSLEYKELKERLQEKSEELERVKNQMSNFENMLIQMQMEYETQLQLKNEIYEKQLNELEDQKKIKEENQRLKEELKSTREMLGCSREVTEKYQLELENFKMEHEEVKRQQEPIKIELEDQKNRLSKALEQSRLSIDKRIVTRLIITLFNKDIALSTKQDALKLAANLLELNEKEQELIGIGNTSCTISTESNQKSEKKQSVEKDVSLSQAWLYILLDEKNELCN
ncbi:golgin subfamily A member 6-like protein 6 [Schistocerca gregaria]|uniref:golgin subfamily A member 6-like protein 6 n=1 Tax=Schistocerca gregaria TaxID=7010 RepID=UPI00211E402E|nr:golgin subfamily A member 6-like protein 6 [Schistocerca gregaria]